MENDTEPNKVKKSPNYSVSEREEGNEDRLSNLPDCILIHLMTFMTTRDSVRTTVLSTRWKDLWKRVPSLALRCCSGIQLQTRVPFDYIVSKVLTLRDGSISLHSLDLHCGGYVPPEFLTRVVRYAVSHGIQHFKLHANCGADSLHCLFSCRSLTSLDLSVSRGCSPRLFPKSLNLTALESLHARNFAFCAGDNELVEPFSSFVKLKTLVIHHCVISDERILCISNATLVNLTIHASPSGEEAYRIVLSTPNLCSFTFSGVIAHQLTASGLSFLKEVNIDVDYRASLQHLQSAFILIRWLQVFANIRSLTVCSSTLQVLSLIPDLLNTESPCLDNLKSLIVNVKKHLPLSWLKSPSHVPDGVVDYLIRNSPFAKVTMKRWKIRIPLRPVSCCW